MLGEDVASAKDWMAKRDGYIFLLPSCAFRGLRLSAAVQTVASNSPNGWLSLGFYSSFKFIAGAPLHRMKDAHRRPPSRLWVQILAPTVATLLQRHYTFCCQSPSTSGLIPEDSITWLRLHRFASFPPPFCTAFRWSVNLEIIKAMERDRWMSWSLSRGIGSFYSTGAHRCLSLRNHVALGQWFVCATLLVCLSVTSHEIYPLT
ncbi:hypothetical protein FA95DRAFT_1426111 [Auriscalpium vulgare]|uniref:Uncharacterized protein n=1 Tax=Auriscalpium vulgare TaxID=40419 RepID=A0ACB8R0M4_9AGAM|nr:hypothetical protein FA95DRAFT_1426111 [Auriscalpium vulgare]